MLDAVDRGIVHALHIDGRAPFNRIGEVLGVSPQTVARRYRRLRTEAGLRVIALPEARLTGGTRWFVRLTAAPAAAGDLARALARRPDTSWVRLTSGGTEIVAIVTAPSTTAGAPSLLLHDVPRARSVIAVSAHSLLRVYLGGVTAWRGRVDALSAEQQRRLRVEAGLAEGADPSEGTASGAGSGAASGSAGSGDSSPYEPEPYEPEPYGPEPGTGGRQLPGLSQPGSPERKLLDAIAQDGRAGYAELAAATGWSQATVARRLAELRSRGTIYFDVEIDDAPYGVLTRAILWMSVTPPRLDHVATALAGHREVAFVATTTGSTNLLAQVLCRDPDALHTYLTGRLAALDGITTMETTPVLHTLKSAGPLPFRPAL